MPTPLTTPASFRLTVDVPHGALDPLVHAVKAALASPPFARSADVTAALSTFVERLDKAAAVYVAQTSRIPCGVVVDGRVIRAVLDPVTGLVVLSCDADPSVKATMAWDDNAEALVAADDVDRPHETDDALDALDRVVGHPVTGDDSVLRALDASIKAGIAARRASVDVRY